MKKQGRVKLFFGLLFYFNVNLLFGQWTIITPKLDSLITVTQPRAFNGAILVSQNGKIKYAATQGVADLDTDVPLSLNDQFFIGSVSKQFTAVLVLKEMEKGKLKPEDTIHKYLPELKQSWADSVTIHQLLSHTSGLVSLEKPLAFKPGTKFLYSPLLAYELLARIAEKTSGKSYPVLIQALFRKSGMENSTIPSLYKNGKLVKSYTEEGGRKNPERYDLKDMRESTPGGGIISTVRDLNLWNESLHNGKLLSPESYKLMTTAYQFRPQHRWGDEVGYGYGLQISKLSGKQEYSHSGALAGFYATLTWYPETKTSIVLLENIAWDSDTPNKSFYIHDEARKLINGGPGK